MKSLRYTNKALSCSMSKINEKLIHDLIILRNNMEDCLFQVPRASYTNLALNPADGSASIVFFTNLEPLR